MAGGDDMNASWDFTPPTVRRTDASVSQDVVIEWSGREDATLDVISTPAWLTLSGDLTVLHTCTATVDPASLPDTPSTGIVTGEVIIDWVGTPDPDPQTLVAAVRIVSATAPICGSGNMLDATRWLDSKLAAHASSVITYTRDAASVSVTATIGRSEFEMDGEYGPVTSVTSRDFLIPTAELILNGAVIRPRRGDVITEAGVGGTYVHEVASPGNKIPEWQWANPYRTQYRVHTKQVGKESV